MPSEKQYLERKENIASILEYLRIHGPKSRRELSDKLHLSWGCISELVSLLMLENILLEEELREPKTKGRVPSVLKLNPSILFLGVDVNINGLNGCVCNLAGEKTAQYTAQLQFSSEEAFVTSVCDFVHTVLDRHDGVAGICFAMQGIYNREKNTWSLPIGSLIIDFDAALAHKFEVPFIVEHDPNCILYGCFEKNEGSKMIVRLDKGIGAAVYKDGAFLKNDLLEIGYMVVGANGERLHELVSSAAVVEKFGFDAVLSAQNSVQAAYFAEIGKYLGITLGNICNLFRLNEIYICGDMIAYYELFCNAMTQHYTATVIPTQAAQIKSVKVTDAAYGAAKMAIDKFQY